MSRFNKIWKKLAKKGKCDSLGGMEWDRVSQEWREWGEKQAIKQFIAKRANLTPGCLSNPLNIHLEPKLPFDLKEASIDQKNDPNYEDAVKGPHLLED